VEAKAPYIRRTRFEGVSSRFQSMLGSRSRRREGVVGLEDVVCPRWVVGESSKVVGG
jgi:hypothetical protein